MQLQGNKYYQQIAVQARILDPTAEDRHASLKENWVTSVDNPKTGGVAGQTVTASTAMAAEWLVNGTHRSATPQEVETEQQRRAEMRETILMEDAERKGRAMPPDMQKLAAALVAGVSAQQQQQRKSKGNE